MPDDDRDADWYRERLPETEELLDLLGDDPAATLLNAAKGRAVADGTIDVTAVADDPDALALVAAAGNVVKKLGATTGPVALTAAERGALDAVVLIVARPALFVRDGKVVQAPPNWPAVRSDHALIEANLRGIASVALGPQVGGTAVLVQPTYALTNNHVVCWLAGLDATTWQEHPAVYTAAVAQLNARWHDTPAAAAELDFLREFGVPDQRRVRIAQVAGTHAGVDVAVLALSAPVPDTRAVPLQAAAPATLTGRPVYVAGYPVIDSRHVTPLFILEKVFGQGQTLSTKRVSPGFLRGLGASELELLHDASTLNGNSGSAVFDFETHEMIGLHYGGRFDHHRNFSVPMWRLLDDALMTTHSIRYSGVG